MEGTQVFVVDASVAVKWYVQEKLRREALILRTDYAQGKIDLIAPQLMIYEVGNALRFRPDVTASDVKQYVKALKNMQVATGDLEEYLLQRAAEIAFDEGITFYDSSYLALAENYGTKVVSADKDLIRKLSRHKQLILDLEGYPAVRAR